MIATSPVESATANTRSLLPEGTASTTRSPRCRTTGIHSSCARCGSTTGGKKWRTTQEDAFGLEIQLRQGDSVSREAPVHPRPIPKVARALCCRCRSETAFSFVLLQVCAKKLSSRRSSSPFTSIEYAEFPGKGNRARALGSHPDRRLRVELEPASWVVRQTLVVARASESGKAPPLKASFRCAW
ncbi:hypothetical protein B0H14DRAFT_2701752 [Mycena olivaceomarginata]|nr:hypothetical protein B0H14DRAFT_2701752 [Mycena olivaceomarginata]